MSPVLFDRWAKSSSFTPTEMQVLEKLLPETSPEARKLLKQAKKAPYVLRKALGKTGYEAIIPYLEDDSLLVEAEQDIESPSVECIDSQSGRRLRFCTAVLRGGFLLGLRGTAVDGGTWPREWFVGSDIVQPDGVFSWLDALTPSMDRETASAILNKLIDWSEGDADHVSEERRSRVRLAAPASDVEIAQCEKRLGTTLPDQYRQFVKITNGFGIRRGRPYELLGTNDIHYLDESRQWIGITPLYEDGYVACRKQEDTATCYLLSPDGSAVEIGDLKQYVRESLECEHAHG